MTVVRPPGHDTASAVCCGRGDLGGGDEFGYILLGVAGSFLGSWLTYQFGYPNSNGGFELIPFIVGVVVAVILIAIYLAATGRRNQLRR